MRKITKGLFSLFLLIGAFIFVPNSAYALDGGKTNISGQNIAEGSYPLKSEGFQISEDGAELSFVEKDESKKPKIVVLVDDCRDFFQLGYSSVRCFFKGLFGKGKC